MRLTPILLFLFATPLFAFQTPENPHVLTPKEVLRRKDVQEVAVFQQYYKGEPSGSMILSRELGDGTLTIRDKTEVPLFKVSEELVSVFAVRGATLRSLSGSGAFGKATVDVGLKVNDGRLSGHTQMGENRQQIDQTLEADVFSRVGLFALLPMFSLEPGHHYRAKMLDSLDGRVYTIDIAVTAAPNDAAGNRVVRAELNGHKARQAFFISNRKTQRIEVLDTTWVYERVADAAALKPVAPPR